MPAEGTSKLTITESIARGRRAVDDELVTSLRAEPKIEMYEPGATAAAGLAAFEIPERVGTARADAVKANFWPPDVAVTV